MSDSFYVTGGTLPGDSPSYVERQADEDLHKALSDGEFCYVLTSRQMGKSSLMIRTAARLKAGGAAVAVLDLTAVGQNVTTEQWYEGLLNQIGQQLHLEDELDDYWLNHERMGPLQRFMHALRDVALLSLAEQRVVLFIDEIDAVRSLPFSVDEFFAAVRECHNRRASDSRYEGLTFCLLGVTTPGELIRDTRTTPFNIGRRIDLCDFTPAEALSLARGLPVEKRTRAALLQRIMFWTDGHPYLTQRLCRAVAEGRVRNKAGVDSLCHRLFLSAEARECDDNLQFVRDRLLRNEVDVVVLLDLYTRILKGEWVPPDDTNPVLDELRLSGAVRLERGRLVVRNRIYRRVFDREWVVRHMPDAELRRQAAAYRKGVIRAGALSGVVITAMAGLTGAALWWAGTARAAYARANAAIAEARDEAERRREMLYASQVAQAHTLIELGMGSRAREILATQIPRPGERDPRHWEWRYLWSRSDDPTIQNFSDRPSQPIRALAFTPNSQSLAIPSWNKVRLYRVPSGSGYASLKDVFRNVKGERDVHSLAISPSGTLVAAANEESVVIWDLSSSKQVGSIAGLREARSIQFSRDGAQLAVAVSPGRSVVWDVRRARTVSQSLPSASCLTYTPDGKRLLLAGEQGVLHVVETAHWSEMDRTPTAAGSNWRIAISADGRTLAASAPEGRVGIWALSNPASGRWRLVGKLNAHAAEVQNVAFSPDGRRLATVGADGTVRLWDAARRTLLYSFDGPATGDQVTFSPNGKWLACCGRGLAKLWNNPSLAKEDVRQLTPGGTLKRDFLSPDGRRLAQLGPSGQLQVIHLLSGRVETLPFRGDHPFYPARVQPFTGDSKVLYGFEGAPIPDGRGSAGNKGARQEGWSKAGPSQASKPLPSRLYRWRLGTNQVDALPAQGPPGAELQGVSADGRCLICASAQHLAVLDAQTGKTIIQQKLAGGWKLSPSGRYLLTHDNEAVRDRLWELATGREVALHLRSGAQGFSPDETLLIYTTGNDAVLREIATGSVRWRLRAHSESISAWAFSPDQSQLAIGAADKTIYLWDLRSGQQKALQGHTGKIQAIAFSPDGARVATFGNEGKIRLWSVPLGRELLNLPVSNRGELYGFDRDGSLLLFREEEEATARLRIWREFSRAPDENHQPLKNALERQPHSAALLREVQARQVDGKSLFNLIPYRKDEIAFTRYWLDKQNDPEIRARCTQANGVTTAFVDATGRSPWAANLDVRKINGGPDGGIKEGKRYVLQFRARSDRNRPITVKVQRGATPEIEIGVEEEVDLSPEWRAFRFTFTARDPEGKAGLSIYTGYAVGRVEVADLLLAEAPEGNR